METAKGLPDRPPMYRCCLTIIHNTFGAQLLLISYIRQLNFDVFMWIPAPLHFKILSGANFLVFSFTTEADPSHYSLPAPIHNIIASLLSALGPLPPAAHLSVARLPRNFEFFSRNSFSHELKSRNFSPALRNYTVKKRF